jgi:mRNA interferase YafQ
MAKKPPRQQEGRSINPKRAPLPRRVDYTAEFRKSWERHNRAGRSDMQAMREVMTLIWIGQPLPAQYLDHELRGEWEGTRECHVGGDFLLIYQSTERDVIFVDLGTHAELFR